MTDPDFPPPVAMKIDAAAQAVTRLVALLAERAAVAEYDQMVGEAVLMGLESVEAALEVADRATQRVFHLRRKK